MAVLLSDPPSVLARNTANEPGSLFSGLLDGTSHTPTPLLTAVEHASEPRTDMSLLSSLNTTWDRKTRVLDPNRKETGSVVVTYERVVDKVKIIIPCQSCRGRPGHPRGA